MQKFGLGWSVDRSSVSRIRETAILHCAMQLSYDWGPPIDRRRMELIETHTKDVANVRLAGAPRIVCLMRIIPYVLILFFLA